MGFQEFKLNKHLLQAVEQAGYTQPTPIQRKAIPLITSGHDIMGVAQTRTGKTAAFVLPLLMKIRYAQGVGGHQTGDRGGVSRGGALMDVVRVKRGTRHLLHQVVLGRGRHWRAQPGCSGPPLCWSSA